MSTWHVMPVADLVDDASTDLPTCVCGPTVEEVTPGRWLIVHHSLDGRENHEARRG